MINIEQTKQKKILINTIQSFLLNDGRVCSAWLFGSFSRGDNTLNSDLDLCIEFNTQKKYSLFDLVDLACLLEKQINIKVDLVEKGNIKDFAFQSSKNDFVKIYGD